MATTKTCFVIIGFGPKPDPESGRIVDLDKTFENLIKPVFDDLKIEQTALGTDSFFASNYAVGPNPASDVVNISAKNNNTINTVEITDINGRLIAEVLNEGTVPEGKYIYKAELGHLPTGTYLAILKTEGGTTAKRVIKHDK